MVDTCPQVNLSYFYDNQYYSSGAVNVRDMIIPYLIPGLGKATHVAAYIGATNKYFDGKNSYYIPSSEELYLLPSQLNTAINQALGLPNDLRNEALTNILYSLNTEIDREMKEIGVDKCIIDTSPFFCRSDAAFMVRGGRIDNPRKDGSAIYKIARVAY